MVITYTKKNIEGSNVVAFHRRNPAVGYFRNKKIVCYFSVQHTTSFEILFASEHWAIPFNKHTPPMDDFSVSVPGGIDTLGYFRIPL